MAMFGLLNRVLVGFVGMVLLAAPVGGVEITEIIHGGLERPSAVAADGAGNVYVAGRFSDNVFQVTPGERSRRSSTRAETARAIL